MKLALALVLGMDVAVEAQGSAGERGAPAATQPVVFVGTACTADGRRARGAVVETSAGGRAVTDDEGRFRLAVEVPLEAERVEIVVAADDRWDRLGLGATVCVVPAALSPTVDLGALVLAPPPSCSARWLPAFGAAPGMDPDIDDAIEAFAVFDDGSGAALYAGGGFEHAGGVAANGVAMWKNSRWRAVGSGSPSDVRDLVVFDDGTGEALYAASDFSVRRWDGTAWTTVGARPWVRALAVFDDGSGPALYAGGQFPYVAKWNGTTWSAVGPALWDFSGEPVRVEALEVFDDGSGPELYAAGSFDLVGDVLAFNIARWDGSSWTELRGGLTGERRIVDSLAVFDDGSGPALYAGGFFYQADGIAARNVAKWNGSRWSALGSGMSNGIGNQSNPHVHSFAVFDDGSGEALYAGGYFETAGGVSAHRIARWDGASWSPVGSGMSLASQGYAATTVHALAGFDDGSGPALYAGGFFASAGGVSAKQIARWDGASWSALGHGLDAPVSALAAFDDGSGAALYAYGGHLASAGGVQTNAAIARWTGSAWSPVGSGLGAVPSTDDNDLGDLAVFDDGSGPALYAGGSFQRAGSLVVNTIARWDGATWSQLGGGFGPSGSYPFVHALEVFDDGGGAALYAGGGFTLADGAPVNRIARWDGSSWSPLGSGIGSFYVRDLAVFDAGSGPALYAAGCFTNAGGIAANHVARWDGTSWSALGGGMSIGSGVPRVDALAVFDAGGGPALYAAGHFTSAGGVPASHVARWNGASWSALGSGVAGGLADVNALAVFDDGTGAALYAGGSFLSAGGGAARSIARWNGSSWSPLGAGVQEPVLEFAVFDAGSGPALFVGGGFQAGPLGNSYLGTWGCAQKLRRAKR